MDNMINLTIDGVQVSVPAGSTVLEAARMANIHIPTLCYLKDVNQIGACRVCVVDVGARALQAACVYPVAEGMVVKTNTPEVRRARKTVVELLLSVHDRKCLSCVRNNNCELQDLCRDLGIDDDSRYAGAMNHYDIDDASVSIVRDNNKCVLCRRCVAACHNNQNVGVIGAVRRGFSTAIESPWKVKLAQTSCVGCGQCIVASSGLRQGLRHRFRRRPDHPGRRHRTGAAPDQRWCAAHDHQLLTGLDQVLRDLRSRLHSEPQLLQEPARNEWRDHQELLCREGRP